MKSTTTVKKITNSAGCTPRASPVFRPALWCITGKTGSGHNRLGVTVSTKLGHAVVRNRVRRRIREIFRLSQGR